MRTLFMKAISIAVAGALAAAAAAAPKVYLYVDKPGLFGAGHAWVGMDPGDGTIWQGGLYPGKSGAKGARNSPGVIRNDSTHGFTHRVCYNVTPAQTAGPGTNCAGWATQKLRTGGVTTPNPTNNAGYPDPYALGILLDQLGCGAHFGGGVVLCDHILFPHKASPRLGADDRPDSTVYISGGYFGYIIMAHGNPHGLAAQLIMPAEIGDAGAVDVGVGETLTISLANVDSEAITSVEWADGSMFDDGALVYTHAFANAGVYNATVIIIDDGAVRNWSLVVNAVDGGGRASVEITAPDFVDAPVFDLPAPPINPPPPAPGPVLGQGDFNFDGAVGGPDLAMLLGDWGSEGGPCDLNDDWIVNSADLSLFLTLWDGAN